MGIYRYFDSRVKKLGIIDLKLVQGASMCVMLVIVKMFPEIMDVSTLWFVAIGLLLAIKPVYAFFIKKSA